MTPSLMCTQCPRAPRGASWNPAPMQSFGQELGSHFELSWIRSSRRAMLAASWSIHSPIFSARTCVSMPRAATRPSVEKSASGPTPSFLSTAETSSLTRARSHLRRRAVVGGRLRPAALCGCVEPVVRGIRPRVFRPRLAFRRVEGLVVSSCVLVPGVFDVLGDLAGVEGLHLRKVPLPDAPGGEEQGGLGGIVLGVLPVDEVVPPPAAVAGPALVEGGDGQEIGDLDLPHEVARLAL